MATPTHGTPYQRALTARQRRAPRLPADPERAAAELRRRLTIGSRIRQARQRLGISQQRLTLMIDMENGRDRISQWETGKAGMSALRLEQIAEAVGEPVHYFYGGPSAHPLPADQDPDPWAQPTPDPAAAAATIGELVQVLERVSSLLNQLGRAGGLIDARLDALRVLGIDPRARPAPPR